MGLNRDGPGTATAAMNLVRCWMGAGPVAAVGPLLDVVGLRWTSVLVAGVWVLICTIAGGEEIEAGGSGVKQGRLRGKRRLVWREDIGVYCDRGRKSEVACQGYFT